MGFDQSGTLIEDGGASIGLASARARFPELKDVRVDDTIIARGECLRVAAAAVPQTRNSMALAAGRAVAFDKASLMIGHEAMAEALGVSRRGLRYKIAGDRGLSDGELELAALALEKRAEELTAYAARVRALAGAG